MNERAREHAPYHDRRLEQQTLDALLRIEETLERLRVDFLRTRREQLVEPKDPEVEEVERLTTKGNTKVKRK